MTATKKDLNKVNKKTDRDLAEPYKDVIDKCDDVASVLKSISHPVRLKILCLLFQKHESTVGELTEFCQISQSAMSQFLGRMKDEGLLEARRESHSVFYSVKDLNLQKLLKSIREIYC